MQRAKGYIIRASDSFSWTGSLASAFVGIPNNGTITTPISRGSFTGVDYTGISGVVTKFDDNLNLVGNPYPSSIKVLDFLNTNTNIQGFVDIWTHGAAPSNGVNNPFYGTFGYNYTANDYITYNGTGTISGPPGFNGYMAAAQGFFVTMNDGATTTGTVTFNNSMRNKNYDNSQFFRTSNLAATLDNDTIICY